MKSFFCLFFFCFSVIFFASAQKSAPWYLTDDDGLPDMTVHDILQDDLGYIWIATANGLCKYDGISIQEFKDVPLIDQDIVDLQKDKWNRIWHKNMSGQLAYIEEDTIVPFFNQAQLKNREVLNFYVGDRYLWLLCKNIQEQDHSILQFRFGAQSMTLEQTISPNKFDPQIAIGGKKDTLFTVNKFEGEFVHTTYLPDTVLAIQDLLRLGDNCIPEVSIPSFHSLKKPFNNSTVFKYSEKRIPEIEQELTSHEWSLHLDKLTRNKSNTIIIIRNASGLKKGIGFNANHCLNFFSVPPEVDITSIKTSNSFYKLLLNTSESVENLGFSLDLEMHLDYNFSSSLDFYKGLNINNSMYDREYNLWLATEGQGVRVSHSILATYSNQLQKSMPDKSVYTFLNDSLNHRILIGHNKGLLSIIPTKEDITPDNFQALQTKVIDLKITGGIKKIIKDHRGYYYVLTKDGIVVLDQTLNETFRQLIPNLKTIFQDRHKRLWLSSHEGTWYYDQDIENSPSVKVSNIIVNRFFEDSSGELWLGTTKGLYHYSDQLMIYSKYAYFDSFYITDIIEQADQNFWISTKDHGIINFKNEEVIQHLTEKEGLPSSHCKQLYFEEDLLWVATAKGFVFLYPPDQSITIYNKADGFPANNIHAIMDYQEASFAGTSQGLVYFTDKFSSKNSTPALINIRAVYIEDKVHAVDSLIELSANQAKIKIDFIGLAFSEKKPVYCQYRMLGLEQEWTKTSNNTASYYNLPPGDYQFEVLAINEDGIKSRAKEITFRVTPPWWKAGWLKVLIFIIPSGLLYLIMRTRHQKKEKERNIEDRINALRQQALQTQMNPHFIFNSLSSIQKSLTTNDQEKALRYLSKFAKLIRAIFEYSKQDEITLEDEIEFLNLYLNLEELRFKHEIKTVLTVAPELENELYDISIPPLLLQPLVENAFKHGLFHKKGRGLLSLKFSIEKPYLKFTIEDNGVGRQKAQLLQEQTNIDTPTPTPSGIRNIENRLQIINSPVKPKPKTILIEDLYENEQATGTRINVYIYKPEINYTL